MVLGLALVLALLAPACVEAERGAAEPAAAEKPADPGENEAPQAGRWRKARSEEDEELRKRLLALGYVEGSQAPSGQGGVSIHDEARAFDGFNFYTSGHAEVAVLMDMQGRVLHEWRKSFSDVIEGKPPMGEGEPRRWWRRGWLLENGDVIALNTGMGLMRLDKDSNVVWVQPLYVHHDLAFREDGGYVTLTRKVHVVPRIRRGQPIIEDHLVYLNAKGEVERRISILEAFERSEFKETALGENSSTRALGKGDLFHTNSIFVLDGKLADRHAAFAAGNLLLSFRPLDAIGILDPKSETVVWFQRGEYARQHDPQLLSNGNLLLFDNVGLGDESRVLELEPLGGEIRWQYRGDEDSPFLSRSCGTVQALPNGNVLVTESDNGRAFEVTREGAIVWEFLSPHRAGEDDEFVATLLDVIRLPKEFPLGWLKE